MRAVLVLNGERPAPSLLRALAEEAPVFAADGGASACAEAGVKPAWVLGDFDSVDPAALPADWTCIREVNQMLTDFEKLIPRLPTEVQEITVLGGLGGRLDHLLSNLICAARLPEAWRVRFAGEGMQLIRVTPSTPLELDLPPGTRISLLALSPAEGVTATGLRWPLREACLGPGPGGGLGQSNLSSGPVAVSVRQGGLWAWVESELRI